MNDRGEITLRDIWNALEDLKKTTSDLRTTTELTSRGLDDMRALFRDIMRAVGDLRDRVIVLEQQVQMMTKAQAARAGASLDLSVGWKLAGLSTIGLAVVEIVLLFLKGH